MENMTLFGDESLFKELEINLLSELQPCPKAKVQTSPYPLPSDQTLPGTAELDAMFEQLLLQTLICVLAFAR